MTGRYPQRFGHEFNIGQAIPAHRDVGLPVEETTMADRLKAAGYRSALVGKWHLGSADRFHPTRRGFDEFFGFLHGAHSYTDPGPNVNPILDGTDRVPSIPYLTDTLADRAADFIKRNRTRPFFLYLAFNASSRPAAGDRQVSRTIPRHYQQHAAHVCRDDVRDGRWGRQDDRRVARGEVEENTLVFFFSDNGGPLTANSWNGSNNDPLRG